MELTGLTIALVPRKREVPPAADLEAESAFWADLLGGEVVREDDDWHQVVAPGLPGIGVQLAPDHVPPTWPADGVAQQLHLDLDAAEGFRVCADPAGHHFCLCWG